MCRAGKSVLWKIIFLKLRKEKIVKKTSFDLWVWMIGVTIYDLILRVIRKL